MYSLRRSAAIWARSPAPERPADYSDLLCLLFLLTKTMMKSKGLIAGSAYRSGSSIFKRYPRICKDRHITFICDTLRMMTMSLEDPHQVETAMKQLEKHQRSARPPPCSEDDGRIASARVVAAVLGIDQVGAIAGPRPHDRLGAVGTFAGVPRLLASSARYGRLKAVVDDEAQFYPVIRDILVAHLRSGNAAQMSVEIDATAAYRRPVRQLA